MPFTFLYLWSSGKVTKRLLCPAHDGKMDWAELDDDNRRIPLAFLDHKQIRANSCGLLLYSISVCPNDLEPQVLNLDVFHV